MFDPQWVCILQVFEGFALIDHDFHGSSIFSYRNELKQTGVKVDFEEAVKEFSDKFELEASFMTKEIVLSFLSCHRQLKDSHFVFPPDLEKTFVTLSGCGLDVVIKDLQEIAFFLGQIGIQFYQLLLTSLS